MLRNRNVFLEDPATKVIPNEGVAQVLDPRTPSEWDVLAYELRSFVCDGEYRRGLDRILNTYLTHLDQATQPAAWISGFYGSGKSHLVRVLEYLWCDVTFPDGVRARTLVKLPDDIRAQFTELTTRGRREGGLWSAAGTLGAGARKNIVRLALLGILFKSAALPVQYAPARFVIWLKQNGYYEAVRQRVEAQGREWSSELNAMYISPILASSLLEVYPKVAPSEAHARALLKEQFPNRDDIDDDELLRTMEEVLTLQSSTPGKLPLTLLVFDELQQFLGEDPVRTLQVQNIVEVCSARFGSRVLFVATGQAQLQATPQLSKLQGRFTVNVTLSDTDVEQVVREVVLRKSEVRIPPLKDVLDRASGEINRHLAGTKIGPAPSDERDLVRDYPLLPVRRRFWERVLRAVDPSGTAGQLRTQLRVVHEATRAIADKPLGTVIAADDIYDQQKPYMLQSGMLQRDMATMIEELNDGTPDGALCSRLCKLIFLIGKLPEQGVIVAGVRADADSLADLFVADLTQGSSNLRKQIPEVLEALVQGGTLMLISDEYRLQTRESAEWEQDFRQHLARIAADDSLIASDRTAAFRVTVTATLKGITLTQGASRVPRKYELHWGTDRPTADGTTVPIWVRDGWAITEKAARDEAQAAGVESPLVTIYLPRRDSEALKAALAGYAAAKTALETRARPTTPEGIEAESAMRSRQDLHKRSIDSLVGNVIQDALVIQGGGYERPEVGLQAAAKTAIEAALDRLFPRFKLADHPHPGWGKVVERASAGAADALTAVGWTGDANTHPVCQEIRAFVGGAGKKGSDVRKHLQSAPYGWPQDAIDGALLALVASGDMTAARAGVSLQAKGITHTQIGQIDFRAVGGRPPTALERLEVRKLIGEMGLAVSSGEEAAALGRALVELVALAKEAGGSPPLPERPSPALIEQLQGLSGNEQIVEFYNHRDELRESFKTWIRARDLITERMPRWQKLQRLLGHTHGRSFAEPSEDEAQAILRNRALLAEPDPVRPLLDRLGAALRAELQAAHRRLTELRVHEVAALEASPEWQRLEAEPGKIGEPQDLRRRLLDGNGLGEVPSLVVGTDDELLLALDDTSLARWEDRIAALPARAAQVRAQIARMLEPAAVPVCPRAATLRTAEEAHAYLAALEHEIMSKIQDGKPVIIQV